MDDDLPYWIDDPYIDRAAHRLSLAVDTAASAAAGRTLYIGTCSCGGMGTPPWDSYAVQERYDWHMETVQLAARRADTLDPRAAVAGTLALAARAAPPAALLEEMLLPTADTSTPTGGG